MCFEFLVMNFGSVSTAFFYFGGVCTVFVLLVCFDRYDTVDFFYFNIFDFLFIRNYAHVLV